MNRYGKRAAIGAVCGAVSVLAPVMAFGSINALVFAPKLAVIGGLIALGLTVVQDIAALVKSRFGTSER